MFYLQATRAPVFVAIGDDQLSVPKLTRRQLRDMLAEVFQKNNAVVTAEMDAVRRAEYLSFYSNFGADIFDARKIVRSDEGAMIVCRTCLALADVKDAKTGTPKERKSAAEINSILEANGTGATATLAWVLADLDDSSIYKAPKPPADAESRADPLAPSAATGSNASQ